MAFTAHASPKVGIDVPVEIAGEAPSRVGRGEFSDFSGAVGSVLVVFEITF